jgi:uncharacterized protein involved in type VI secretion and phage assembly
MTLTLFETIQRIVQQQLAGLATSAIGVVQDQQAHADAGDTGNYSCTVALRDSGIVLEQVPVATGRIGQVAIPAVGEMVLVEFVGGDLNAPVIVARLYSDGHRPPPSDDGQAVLHVPPGAEDADAVHVALSSADPRELTIALGSGVKLALRDDDPAVELDVGDGKAKLTIGQDGTVTLEAKALTLSSRNAVEVKGNDVSITAQGKLTLKGSTVNIN